MCGIVGKLLFDPSARIEEGEVHAMLRPISYRGPDGNGVYLNNNVGLGHVRLSIIDLAAGVQPMSNENKSIWIVFNGEIYNFRNLRQCLISKGHHFATHSDTETIIHAYEEYGPSCVEKLRGMFAFAIWDLNKRRLFIARDRVGIKPCYYYYDNKSLYFASELKSILASPYTPRNLNLSAVRAFFSFQYIPGNSTLLENFSKLPPGHYLTVENGVVTIQQYWNLKYSQQRWHKPYNETVEELDSLLATTINDHLVADVPVGVLLSGGMDSTAVLSYATRHTDRQIKTFTLGFEGNNVVDERPFARIAAKQFNTDHYETTMTAQQFWDFLPKYARHMESPVCEPPAVALFHVAQLAHQHVKVVLSGEGGDEVFGGYPNYPKMLQIERIEKILGPLAGLLGSSFSFLGRSLGDGRIQRYGYAFGKHLSSHYFSRTSSPTSFFNLHAHRFFTSEFIQATSAQSPSKFIEGLLNNSNPHNRLDQMLYIDTKTWLPDDLLLKADTMTMATSIELRVPLLDHILLEFACSIPPHFKVHASSSKRILKSVFSNRLPNCILQRKKAGFPVPYDFWLRNSFHAHVSDLLLSGSLLNRNIIHRHAIIDMLNANRKRGLYAKELFSLCVFENCMSSLF